MCFAWPSDAINRICATYRCRSSSLKGRDQASGDASQGNAPQGGIAQDNKQMGPFLPRHRGADLSRLLHLERTAERSRVRLVVAP
jgi:hypothetical protein